MKPAAVRRLRQTRQRPDRWACALLTALFPLLACLPAAPAEGGREPDRLEILQSGFPRVLAFRGNWYGRWQAAGVLDQNLALFGGSTMKYAGEEGRFDPDLPGLMAAFKKRLPREMCLVHVNGEARKVDARETHERYFPGHWIHRAGCLLKDDIAASSTTIPVEDARLFARSRYTVRGGPEDGQRRFNTIIIVPLDARGARLWREAEYAVVTGTNNKENTLEVRRGQFFSRPRAFKAGTTCVAPLHCEHWGGLMWSLNTSTACPKDEKGETAADIAIREMKAWCAPGGPAAHVDGISFDVVYFLAKFEGWDLDNDGVAEDGIGPDGRRFFLEGVYDYLRRTRAALGDDFLLTSDGWEPHKQRAVGILNGIESEGFCAPNDAWRRFDRTLNTHTYWNLWNAARPRFSYITSKIMDEQDQQHAQNLVRMGLGTACALGVAYTSVAESHRRDGVPMIAEMHRGAAGELHWMGQPAGPMQLLPRHGPDLLAPTGGSASAEYVERIQTSHCTVSLEADGSLLIRGAGAGPHEPMEIRLPPIPVPQGDLFVSFEVQAVDPFPGFPPADGLPRLLMIHAQETGAAGGTRGSSPRFSDTMSLLGTAGYTPQYGYWRDAGGTDGEARLSFTFEGQGAVRLRRLTAHNAPLVLAREFERGVVVVNGSRQPASCELSRFLPALAGTRLRRIRADPAAYHDRPGIREMLAHNDGRLEQAAAIVVPGLDALFLEKVRP